MSNERSEQQLVDVFEVSTEPLDIAPQSPLNNLEDLATQQKVESSREQLCAEEKG